MSHHRPAGTDRLPDSVIIGALWDDCNHTSGHGTQPRSACDCFAKTHHQPLEREAHEQMFGDRSDIGVIEHEKFTGGFCIFLRGVLRGIDGLAYLVCNVAAPHTCK